MIIRNGLLRRVPAVACLAAVLATGAFTAACGQEEEQAPETSTTTTTTTTTTAPPPAPATPTEKAPRIDPGQPNPFSPSVHAPPAPGPTPGRHRGPHGQ
ncbi:hypothetical protein A5765_05330 [Mycolicibacterium celeriflavum]|uniref:Uncharacterized protein n=1 Tax=Mycolicibacterium celeriflavum TaxID=1249101 RepID=A0A1X0BL36_MYCCF|nr:hypothetical protein [Mycolicibacterium celeriflavum]MCV7239698.1 hypothetical protein [Mycolicibacterium celeriflavum]OBG17546.1 hypothetical protein A5765_05330 [Mycolicibacterium celeriflavum]ORA43301.1 hypothetical protein BST21_22025 [Mycolicibacterium celeriflavum]BBY44433.1 hypothetical protein MCEL_27280 [Mycolicibacterium celeriflavum]